MANVPESTKGPSPERVRALLDDAKDPVVRTLEAFAYTETGWEQGPDEFGPSTTLLLANRRAGREVHLTLAWVVGEPVADVMIVRTPRKSVSDDLFLSLFARKANPELDPTALEIDPGKPVPEEVHRVMSVFAELLAGPAAALLRGEAWEEGHYVDWTL